MDNALDGAFVGEADAERSDALLAESAKVDSGAFGELYERYYTRVYRYVFHRLGNPADAEDVTALVFMKALEGLPSFQPRRSGFAPWLFRITRNAVVDHYRRSKKQTALTDHEQESQTPDPESSALGKEQREEMQAVIAQLSPDQRDVVLMRFAADLSYAEISSTLNKNEAAVRMLLHRGLRKMKAVMDDE